MYIHIITNYSIPNAVMCSASLLSLSSSFKEFLRWRRRVLLQWQTRRIVVVSGDDGDWGGVYSTRRQQQAWRVTSFGGLFCPFEVQFHLFSLLKTKTKLFLKFHFLISEGCTALDHIHIPLLISWLEKVIDCPKLKQFGTCFEPRINLLQSHFSG